MPDPVCASLRARQDAGVFRRAWPPATWQLIAAVLCAILLGIMARSAWIGDDAYISLRVVDNFHSGYGLRWNAGERVWAFTNPLMTLWLIACYPVTRELYLTCIFLSLAASAAATAIALFRFGPRSSALILVATILVTSKAFIDYSTSGLENCFSYLLLAMFYLLTVKPGRASDSRWLGIAFVTGFSLLNRMDTVLLELPVLAWSLWRYHDAWRIVLLAVGLLPFVAWEALALVYYGTLVPNTYYAKLAAGIPAGATLIQGAVYYMHSLWSDPVTLPAILAVLLIAFRTGRAWHVAAGLGILAYMAYAGWVNDFMSGRFFAVPMLCAAMLLGVLLKDGLVRCSRAATTAFCVLLLATSSLHPLSPLTSNGDYDLGRTGRQHSSEGLGIEDERAYYYAGAGLLRGGRFNREPNNIWRRIGEGYRDSTERVRVDGCIGFRGFYAGPGVHFVDPCGLGDLLLARLPARLDRSLQPGNYLRIVPDGYVATLRDGVDEFPDRSLGQFYEVLRGVACDPVWSKRRWAAIWGLHTGRYRHLIDAPRYQVATPGEFVRLKFAPFRRLWRVPSPAVCDAAVNTPGG